MEARELLEANLPLVDRLIGRICRRAAVYDADAEDFASHVKLRLIEDDYAILRKWDGGSLATFLAVVIQRMLIDVWRERGRWTPSAEARRHGTAGVALETLLVRDGRSIGEALPAVQAIDSSFTAERMEHVAAQFPRREPVPRSVSITEAGEQSFAATATADDRVREADARHTSDRTNQVVRAALDAFPVQDRMLIRLRFLSSMSIADISRIMNVPQRPLYRRLEALLATLRRQLATAGVDANALADVIGSPREEIDFGWKTESALPSSRDVEAERPGSIGQ